MNIKIIPRLDKKDNNLILKKKFISSTYYNI